MHFTSYLQDRQLTVALTGEIDHHCAKEYMQHISEKIESYTPAVCVLDFTPCGKWRSWAAGCSCNPLRSSL